MIHDIILALGGIRGEALQDILFNEGLVTLYPSSHPCEKTLVKQLIQIADKYKMVQDFMKKVSHFGDEPITLDTGVEVMPGMYLRAFCDGVYECLEPYRKNITKLERNILENPYITLSGVLSQVTDFVPLLNTLESVINQIGARKLHGCKILQLIHPYLYSGVDIVDKAMARIMRQCHTVMLKQLTSWLLYGQLIDPYSEFFIECCPVSSRETVYSSMTTLDSESLPENQLNEISSSDFKIVHDLVPSYIPISVAEKAKFIGLTVLLFSQDPQGKKTGDNRKLHDSLTRRMESSLLQQLTSLQDSLILDISLFESVLDNIRSFVTQHLFSLAKDKADLMGELTLIKDCFLIGRGELYVLFLQNAKHKLFKPVTNNSAKELNKILSTSLMNCQLNSEVIIEKLSFKIPPKDTLSTGTTAWSAMTLQYTPPWPLHLLFSPHTLTMYNTLLKFLLQVKFAELRLHGVWIDHAKRKDNPLPAEVWTLRNNLMFLVQNLQCYLQLDVLESEYSILIRELQATHDFEQVIHHHTKFLAHISSQSFLLTQEVHNPDQPTTVKQHPVNKCIVEILRLCDVFCSEVCKATPEKGKFQEVTEQLDKSVIVLMNLITLLGNRASGLHLLLLRLDYNRYFSTKSS